MGGGGTINRKAGKRLLKALDRYMFISTSSLSTLLSLFCYLPDSLHPDLGLRLVKLIQSCFALETDTKEIALTNPCECSNCLQHIRQGKITIFHPSSQTESYVAAWKESLHAIGIFHVQQTTSMILRHLLTAIQSSPHFHCNLLAVEFVHSSCYALGLDALLDVIESLWNGDKTTQRLSLLTTLVAHSPLLDFSSALHILLTMIDEATPSKLLLRLVLHTLLVQASLVSPPLDSAVASQLARLVDWCDGVEDSLWREVSSPLRRLCATEVARLLWRPLCCRRWCVHACEVCGEATRELALADTRCVVCRMRGGTTSLRVYQEHRRETGCEWRAPQSVHRCPVCDCEGDGDSSIHDDTHNDIHNEPSLTNPPHNTCMISSHGCLCQTGAYPLCYDYSSSSESEEMETPQGKRRRLEEMQQVYEETQQTVRAFLSIGPDVILTSLRYLSVKDLLAAGACSKEWMEVADHPWIWRELYRSLFVDYQCNHSRTYKHPYRTLYRKRVSVLQRFGQTEHVCQVCGCNRHFKTFSLFLKHVSNDHGSLLCLKDRLVQSNSKGRIVPVNWCVRYPRFVRQNATLDLGYLRATDRARVVYVVPDSDKLL